MPPPFIRGGGAYSITLVRTSVRTYIRTSRTSCPLSTENGFRAISFEDIGVLDWYFIYRYIIIKYRSSSITDKNTPIIMRVMALDLRMKNGFWAISFEYIGLLDSYFIHRYVIIIYSQVRLRVKSTDYYQSYGPWFRYEKWFPGDIFWKHWWIGFIFHTQVYNHKIQVKFDHG